MILCFGCHIGYVADDDLLLCAELSGLWFKSNAFPVVWDLSLKEVILCILLSDVTYCPNLECYCMLADSEMLKFQLFSKCDVTLYEVHDWSSGLGFYTYKVPSTLSC